MCALNHNSPHMRTDVSQELFQVLMGLLAMVHSELGLLVLTFPVYQQRKHIGKHTHTS